MHQTWYFPEDLGGEQKGLNDAGIEFFKSAGSLARETVQNSGDAHSGGAKPVTVKFHLRKVAKELFPGRTELASVIASAEKTSMSICQTPEQRAANGEAFFAAAKALLSAADVPVLQISDFNTTGLEGSEADQMKGWFRLVRKQGSTSMHGAGGGTFGIGQRAPFAYSDLRTVFYGTKTVDGTTKFIGKCILCTFKDGDDKIRREVGFWGTKKETGYGVNPLSDLSALEKIFRREAPGTDLFIAGFRRPDWVDDVLHSVFRNFFAAILHEKLIVEFDDDYTPFSRRVSKANLLDEIEALSTHIEQSERTTAEKRELSLELTATKFYIAALQEPHGGAPNKKTLSKLGDVSLYLKLDDQGPSRVAHMRRPRILVFDRVLRAGFRGYAAVFICDNDKGNKLLAELEDPAHQKWERQRKSGGAALVQELNSFIRDELQAVAGSQDNDAQEIPDLGKYLPADSDDATEIQLGGTQVTHKASAKESGKPTALDVRPTVTRIKQKKAAQRPVEEPGPSNGLEEGATGAGGHNDGQWGDGNGGDNAGTGEGQGGGAEPGLRNLRESDIDYRSFTDASGAIRLIVWARRAGTANLKLTGAGIAGKVDLRLLAAEDENGVGLSFQGNVLQGIVLNPNIRRRLMVRLDQPGRVALSVGVASNE